MLNEKLVLILVFHVTIVEALSIKRANVPLESVQILSRYRMPDYITARMNGRVIEKIIERVIVKIKETIGQVHPILVTIGMKHGTLGITGNSEPGIETKSLLDNCCTATIVNDKTYFTKYNPYDRPLQLGTFREAPGNGKHNDIVGEGKIDIVSQYNGKDHVIKLSRCLYVPRARNSLICQGQLFKLGYAIDAQPEGTYVVKGGEVIAFLKTMDNPLQEVLSF